MRVRMHAFVRGARSEPNLMPPAPPKASRSRTAAVWNASTTKTARSAQIWSVRLGVACSQTPRNVRRMRIVRPTKFATTLGAAEQAPLVLAGLNPIVAKPRRVTPTAFADWRATANVSHRPNVWQSLEMWAVHAPAAQSLAYKTDAVPESFALSRQANLKASVRWLSFQGVNKKSLSQMTQAFRFSTLERVRITRPLLRR